jgi:hypothetical protein
MTSGWSDARDWLITLPTAQELAADIGVFGKGQLFRSDGLFREKGSMSAMTATEVQKSLSETLLSREYLDLLEACKEKVFKSFYLGEFPTYEEKEKPMIGMRQYVTAMKAPPKPPEPKVTPIIDRILCVGDLLAMNRIPADSVSIVLPESDWLILRSEIELYYNVKPEEGASSLRYCNIEFLRGSAARGADHSVWFNKIPTNSMALTEQIIRCLSGGRVSKLPESTGGDRVSAGPDSSGKVGVTSGPTIGNNRNGNSVRHIPDQLDVVSAKAAIAAYARDKKLPGSVSLAQLRELDGRLAGKKGTGLNASAIKRTAKILSENEVAPDSPPTYIWYDEAAKARKLWARAARFNNVEGDGHSLSSEPLSRAINQLNVAEDGRAHRDFIGAAAQGFAEMLDAGDASADRKR